MKNFSLFFVAVLGFIALSFASAESSDMLCTMEYAPVCAKVQVQCIRAPCYPVYQTFSNSCVMSQTSQAMMAHIGECTSGETGAPAVLSDRLKNSLKRQYDVFSVRIAWLSTPDRLAKLQIIHTRILDRLAALSLNRLPQTLEQEMMSDRMKYALLFIQNLTETDIAYLTDESEGMRYISRSSEMCSNIRFYCSTTEIPFFNERGCGCKK